MDITGRPLPSFEFDERKSRINKLKHGIDFVEAQALWLDEALDEIAARHPWEPRSLAIGRIGGKHWTAVVTRRGDRLRLISVRRSRAKEVERYERR
jgi:uncharacterized DUF497 family protein